MSNQNQIRCLAGALLTLAAGITAANAVPYNVNDNTTRHLVLTVTAFDNPSVVQGASLVYRAIDRPGTSPNFEEGVNVAAFETTFSADSLRIDVKWDSKLWELSPVIILVKTAERWGTYEVGGWNSTFDSLVLENRTIRTDRTAGAPLALLQSIAVYGTVGAKTTIPGGPSGPPSGRIPDEGSPLLLLGATALWAILHGRRRGTNDLA